MMNRFIFLLNYAANGLKRGGQRIVIAMLAIVFGVMSLIAMASLANAIDHTLADDPQVELGGDLRLRRPQGSFGLDGMGELETLRNEGLIESYSPVSEAAELLMRTDQSGRARFIQLGFGISPTAYPLVGELTLQTPDGASPDQLLLESGAVLITKDLATRYDIQVGDLLRLAQTDGKALGMEVHVVGILADTPDHRGGRLYYDMATAQALHGQEAIVDYVVVRTSNPDNAYARLEALGWQIQTPQDISRSNILDLFDFMLRGAGILGLMVGGIGIANTMQVLLAQRRQEVGILKTLGYSQYDLMLIFVLEALLLGVLGSSVGAALAILVGRGLVTLFSNVSNLLLVWELNLPLSLGGFLIGVITTVLFASYAILQTSHIRPTVIFRREPFEAKSWRRWLNGIGFYALLSIPFTGITSLILGSMMEGIGILLLAVVGLVAMTLLLGILLWVALRLLPTYRLHLLQMARNNMRQRMLSMIYPMIALFVGIFTLGFALTIIQVSASQFASRYDDADGYNLLVYADGTTVGEVEALLVEMHAGRISRRYQVNAVMDGLLELQARDAAWDMDIVEGQPFSLNAEGGYVHETSLFNLGDDVAIISADGRRHSIKVVGRYRTHNELLLSDIPSLIISTTILERLNIAPTNISIYAELETTEADLAARQIGTAIPQTLTLTYGDIQGEINGLFRNLLWIALAFSGLALLAGVMLVANVVSLAMLDRRYEIGVMKAVGYTQWHVLWVLALEYSLIGFITSLVGVIGIQGVILLILATQEAAVGVLWIHPITALIVISLGVVLTLATALVSVWQTIRIQPLAVLNANVS